MSPTDSSIRPVQPNDFLLERSTRSTMASADQYWCQKRIVVSITTKKGTIDKVVDKPCAVVGSDPTCDVPLPDQDLRAHVLYLHANEYGVYALPISLETEGVPSGWLAPRDKFRIGNVVLRVALEGQKKANTQPGHDWPRLGEYGSTSKPIPELTIYRKGQALTHRRVRAALTLIGRNHPSSIRIPSRGLSRCHCALFWEAKQLWFVDLCSRTHVLQRGNRVSAGRLDLGESIRLGSYEFAFEGFEGQRGLKMAPWAQATTEPKNKKVPSGSDSGLEDDSSAPLDQDSSVSHSGSDVLEEPSAEQESLRQEFAQDRDRWSFERSELTARVKELETQLNAQNELAVDLENRLRDAEASASEMHANINELRESNELVSLGAEDARKNALELEQRCTDLEAKRGEAEAEGIRLAEIVEQLEKSLHEASEKLAGTEASLLQQNEQRVAGDEERQAELTDLRQKYEASERRAESLAEELKAARTSLDEATEQQVKLREQMKTLDDSTLVANEEQAQVREQVAELRSERETHLAEIARLRQALEILQADHATALERQDQTDREHTELQTKLAGLELLSQQIADLKKDKAGLTQELANRADKVASLESSIAQLKSASDQEASVAIETLQSRLGAERELVSERDEKIKKLSKQLDDLAEEALQTECLFKDKEEATRHEIEEATIRSEAALEELTTMTQEFEAKLAEAVESRDRIQQALVAEREKSAEQQQIVASLTDREQSLQKALAEERRLREEQNEKTADKSSAAERQKKEAELRDAAEQAESRCDELSKQIEMLSKERDAAIQNVKESEELFGVLELELAESKEEYRRQGDQLAREFDDSSRLQEKLRHAEAELKSYEEQRIERDKKLEGLALELADMTEKESLLRTELENAREQLSQAETRGQAERETKEPAATSEGPQATSTQPKRIDPPADAPARSKKKKRRKTKKSSGETKSESRDAVAKETSSSQGTVTTQASENRETRSTVNPASEPTESTPTVSELRRQRQGATATNSNANLTAIDSDELLSQPVAESTTRLSSFASTKRGRRPLLQRLAVMLVWLFALGLVGGLIWVIGFNVWENSLKLPTEQEETGAAETSGVPSP